MKRIQAYFIATLLVLGMAGMSGCNKFLEIPPEGEIPAEEALQTPEDVQLLLNSCYDVMRSGKFMGGNTWILSDLMADNMDGRDLQGDWLAYFSHNTGIFITATRDLWSEPYIMIYRCNTLLENMDLVPGLPEDQRLRTEAEARMLRAIGHFELVRMFGHPYGYTPDNSHPGVPLRLAASQEQLPRATVGEVYASVLSDLEYAAGILPDQNNGYGTSWAAKAYLAKVHFQMNEFQEAFDYADDVINNGPFMLESDVMARFSPLANSENIFALVSTGNLNHSGGALSGAYRSVNLANPPGGRINGDLYTLATNDTSDLRGKNWYVVKDEGAPTEIVLLTRFNEDYFNVPVAHLAEMKLLRGECAAELGFLGTAEDDLNDIRNRAQATPVQGGLDAASLIALIQAERRLEMVGEGVRLHDLKRHAVNGHPGTTINGAPWDCPGMIVQLPDVETSGNPDLVLNDEGGC